MARYDAWAWQMANAEAVRAAILACCAPSPTRDRWVARTDAAIRLMWRNVLDERIRRAEAIATANETRRRRLAA